MLRLAALLLAGVVALSACGGDEPSGSSPSPSAARDNPTGDEALNPGSAGSSDAGEGGVAGLPSGGAGSGIPGLSPVEQDDMTDDPALGAQVFSMWRDWDVHEELMDELVAAGSHWIRFDVGWCSLEERGPGQLSSWYQTRLDATVAAARERGLSMLVTLSCSPTWARADGRSRALPEDPSQYGRIAEYLASRYAGDIAAWEMWNEPDCLDVGCANGSAKQYVPVLRAGYRGIKAGDPKATVISGGISGINLTWIQTMLDNGAGEFMDALSVNPYENPSSAPPDTPATQGYQDRYRLTNAPAAHDLLTRAGYPDMPIWVTEIGWSTGRAPDRPRYDGVDAETQAAYLTQAVDLINDRYPFITHIFWFTTRDRDDATVNENGFGLLGLDLTPKPSYAAFTAANAKLN